MKDLTGGFDYDRLIREEKEHYSEAEITADLKEGGGHTNASWGYYWRRVGEAYAGSPYASMPAFIESRFADVERSIEILSLGSGYCGHELALSERLGRSHRMTCTDVNPELFARARDVVAAKGLSVEFQEVDLNFIELEPNRYDLIVAHAVLHHVINLEHLFDQVAGGLREGGALGVTEVVGPNRKQIWEENENLANALLAALPEDLIGGLRLDVADDDVGMEGIRQEDILPLLHERFEPLFELRHGAFMRFVCTQPEIGRRLDPDDPKTRGYLDFLIDCDQSAVERGLLQPLEVHGFYVPHR